MADIMPYYAEALERLLEEFPELKDQYEETCRYWSPDFPPSHIVFVDIFTAELKRRVYNPARDPSGFIHRSFIFIEEMLSNNPHPKMLNLVDTGIMESLLGDTGGAKVFIPLMGKRSQALAKELMRTRFK